MKTKITFLSIFILLILILTTSNVFSQGQNYPWTTQQLMAPADLAKVLQNPKSAQPIVFSIGMEAVIKNSIDIGPVMLKENLNLLKQKLEKLPKNSNIVVYCGCCPFSKCPNVGPAMVLLKNMQFTNYKLLNLPQNIKVDWIDKNYPMAE